MAELQGYNIDLSSELWTNRYKKNNETFDESLHRVADYLGDNDKEREDFYNLFASGKFMCAGRVMSNAGVGTKLTMNNCYNLNSVPDDMSSIYEQVKIAALTQQAGGGCGHDFSLLRPRGTITSNNAVASGVVSFMSVFNQMTDTVLQGNRRGANMGVLNIYHPDIYDFLACKSKTDSKCKFEYFNLSVMVDDDFMNAVMNDEEIYLHYPVYDEKWHIIKDRTKWTQYKKVKAVELWDIVMNNAYRSGDYGVLFYDTMNRNNNVSYCETIISTNPCGEFVSGIVHNEGNPNDYRGACNLGSVFLSKFVKEPFTENAWFDIKELTETVHTAVRILDSVIDKNYYPHPSFEKYQKHLRTIGLGITGLGDVMAMMQIKYGSEESIELTDTIMNMLALAAYNQSVELAKEKGAFPGYTEEFLNSEFLAKQKIGGWDIVKERIKKYGIRNARLISVAPTGTLSLVYGDNCSSGCEPIFQLEQKRLVKVKGQNESDKEERILINPAWAEYLKLHNIDINNHDFDQIEIPDYFTTALKLDVSAHLSVLSAIAEHVDMSISKTINVPESASFEEVKDIYTYCWKNGIKGCTIFRPNAFLRGIFVTDDNKKQEQTCTYCSDMMLPRGMVLAANDDLLAFKKTLRTGCGKFYLHLDFDETTGEPYETFIDSGSGGTCERNLNFISRLMSLLMRGGISIDAIIDQAMSIKPCNAYLKRKAADPETSRGTSCPSAIGFALQELKEKINGMCIEDDELEESEEADDSDSKFLSVCPECGEKTVQQEGGCNICTNCGWSKCG